MCAVERITAKVMTNTTHPRLIHVNVNVVILVTIDKFDTEDRRA
jgi:hypothetical protein